MSAGRATSLGRHERPARYAAETRRYFDSRNNSATFLAPVRGRGGRFATTECPGKRCRCNLANLFGIPIFKYRESPSACQVVQGATEYFWHRAMRSNQIDALNRSVTARRPITRANVGDLKHHVFTPPFPRRRYFLLEAPRRRPFTYRRVVQTTLPHVLETALQISARLAILVTRRALFVDTACKMASDTTGNRLPLLPCRGPQCE
jgi:hypothetical protein